MTNRLKGSSANDPSTAGPSPTAELQPITGTETPQKTDGDSAAAVNPEAARSMAQAQPAALPPIARSAPLPGINSVYIKPDPLTLNGNELQVLLDRFATHPLPGVKNYADLGHHFQIDDQGRYVLHEGKYVKTAKGLGSWNDLATFIDLALAQMPETEQELQLVLKQYHFPTLEIPHWALNRIAQRAKEAGKRVSLSLQGDPLDGPRLLLIDESGTVSKGSLSFDHTAFWLNEDLQAFLKDALNPEQRLLFEALDESDSHFDSDTDWGTFISNTLKHYNEKAASLGVTQIRPDRRTEIFSRLENLEATLVRAAFSEEGLRQISALQLPLWQGINLFSPLTRYRNIYLPNQASSNAWISIGTGQMIATLEFARHLMDIGALPLDFRLVGVDLVEGLIQELNEKGTNYAMSLSGDTTVNPEGRKKIYIINGAQRDEALALYRPDVVLLNLKASFLGGVVSDDFISIIRAFSPVLATPAKAYDNEGLLPYLVIYDKLTAAGHPDLAANFMVLGGFFAAPDILRQDKVDMTIAGESDVAGRRLLRGMSPNPLDDRGRANWEGVVNLKLIPSAPLATALMAGGANKNVLTYESGHELMGPAQNDMNAYSQHQVTATAIDLVFQAMRQKGHLTDRARSDIARSLNARIAAEAADNIEVGEEITARYIAHYPFQSGIRMATDHLWSPEGLKQDFINCLPTSSEGIIQIAETLYGIIESRNVSELDRLIELVRLKMGGGTRNARDGYIDAIIRHAYLSWAASGVVALPYEKFYEAHYPKKWTGPHKQEGRNGIGPLITFAMRHGITLPRKVYEAWNLYHPQNRREVPSEKINSELLAADSNRTWGLPQGWLEGVFDVLHQLKRNLGDLRSKEIKPSSHFFIKGLEALAEAIKPVDLSKGAVPEVNRRIGVIQGRLAELIATFRQNREETAQQLQQAKSAGLSDKVTSLEKEQSARLTHAANQLTKTIHHMERMKREGNITELLNKLRHAAQDLYRVELAVRNGLGVKLGLVPEGRHIGADGGFEAGFASLEGMVDDIGVPFSGPSIGTLYDAPQKKDDDGSDDPSSGSGSPSSMARLSLDGSAQVLSMGFTDKTNHMLTDGALALAFQPLPRPKPKHKPADAESPRLPERFTMRQEHAERSLRAKRSRRIFEAQPRRFAKTPKQDAPNPLEAGVLASLKQGPSAMTPTGVMLTLVK